MFFNSFVLTKKGPLAKIWLAAHWEKKLTKSDINLCDISEAVVQIIAPQVPISCRTSGELLLGCVRIYANKVAALLKESQDATSMVMKTKGKGLEQDGEHAQDQTIDKDKITYPGGIEDIPVPKGLDLDVEDIDVLLGKNANEARAKADADARAMIDDEWFQADTSQAFTGLGDSQASINLTQDALRELRAGPDGGPDRLGSESEGRSSKPAVEAELDVGKPATDEEEEELQRLLREGGPVPDDELALTTQMPVDDDALKQEQDLAGQPVDQFELDEPKSKRVRMVKSADESTILSKETMQRNQKNQSEIITKELRRYPGWTLGPQAFRERMQSVARQLLDAPLTLRDNGEFGKNVPMVCVAAVEVGEGDVDGVQLFRNCIQQQLAEAAQALQTQDPQAPPMDEDQLQMSQMQDIWGLDENQPQLGEFGKLPEIGDTPARARRLYESTGVDPVVSARRTLDELRKKMKKDDDSITLQALVKNGGRRAAAQRFMDLLVLGSKGHVNLAQPRAYGPITVTRAKGFHKVVVDDEEST